MRSRPRFNPVSPSSRGPFSQQVYSSLIHNAYHAMLDRPEPRSSLRRPDAPGDEVRGCGTGGIAPQILSGLIPSSRPKKVGKGPAWAFALLGS
jgi:hypothetical protein